MTSPFSLISIPSPSQIPFQSPPDAMGSIRRVEQSSFQQEVVWLQVWAISAISWASSQRQIAISSKTASAPAGRNCRLVAAAALAREDHRMAWFVLLLIQVGLQILTGLLTSKNAKAEKNLDLPHVDASTPIPVPF